MLDLIPNNSRLSDIRDGIQYDHSDPFDLSLFTDRAVFERVPIAAEIEEPYYNDNILNNVGIDNYHAVLNKATGQLVDMRPIPKSYQLVPHQDMMQVQAQQLLLAALEVAHEVEPVALLPFAVEAIEGVALRAGELS